MTLNTAGFTQDYDSYSHAGSPVPGYRKQCNKDSEKKAENSRPAGFSDKQETAKQTANASTKQNRLMEVFEQMQHKGGACIEERKIEDPFGLIHKETAAPYASYADKNGEICYRGVRFKTSGSWLCLGDVSNMKNVIRIPFGKGRGLMVNRNNITELGRAISMFSPEEQNLILRALQLDAKIREVQEEVEAMGDDVGKTDGQARDEPDAG